MERGKDNMISSEESLPPAIWTPPEDFAGKVQVFAQLTASLGRMSGGMMVYAAQRERSCRCSIAVLTDVPMEMLKRKDIDVLQTYLFGYGISASEEKSAWIQQFAEDCAGDVQLRYEEQTVQMCSFDEIACNVCREFPFCICKKDRNEMGFVFSK